MQLIEQGQSYSLHQECTTWTLLQLYCNFTAYLFEIFLSALPDDSRDDAEECRLVVGE